MIRAIPIDVCRGLYGGYTQTILVNVGRWQINMKSLAELAHGDCRFPVVDRNAHGERGNYLFCGATAAKEKSYCSACAKIVYRPLAFALSENLYKPRQKPHCGVIVMRQRHQPI
jgi:hypothetical protein